MRAVHSLALLFCVLQGSACGGGEGTPGETLVTFSGSAVGSEARVLQGQLDRFMALHPDIRVEIQATPDAADQRHQLYVQWLNARTPDPDILQLDVVWTPEFAAAGWILPLDGFGPESEAFFPTALSADRWNGVLYALPWFVDVGLLYWRTDLVGEPPGSYRELAAAARQAMARSHVASGFLWQGARYEGLVTVFLERLHAFGGAILDEEGRVAVDSDASVQALGSMLDEVRSGITPEAALTWQEEQTRFAFQNGESVFLRNWPYAARLLADSTQSQVAGRFAVAPLPAGPGGVRAAALGGQQLAINAHTEEAEAAWLVVEFLSSSQEMLERARAAGQYPTRVALYRTPELAGQLGDALGAPPEEVGEAIESAVARPLTPRYTELSGVLQVWLHRALTGQVEPREALRSAAAELRDLLAESDVGSGG